MITFKEKRLKKLAGLLKEDSKLDLPQKTSNKTKPSKNIKEQDSSSKQYKIQQSVLNKIDEIQTDLILYRENVKDERVEEYLIESINSDLQALIMLNKKLLEVY